MRLTRMRDGGTERAILLGETLGCAYVGEVRIMKRAQMRMERRPSEERANAETCCGAAA